VAREFAARTERKSVGLESTITYNNNGNTTSKTVSGGTTNYTWDYENRLASVTLPGTGGSITFKYDPLGRRIQKAFTQNSTTTTANYLYDGSNAVADIDQNGNVLSRYAETQNIDEPLAELRSGTTSYYEVDGLGSVTSLTSGAGAIANTYTYDSFGTASTGSTTNRFQYTAREFDSESGLYYYRARYYDPVSGRFVSEDPLRFGSNSTDFYNYVGNGPTDYADPTGLCPDLNRFLTCAKPYYGAGTAATRLATAVAAVPFPKSWLGLPSALGSGSLTNIPSALSLGAGTAASGSNVLRIAGRIAGPVGIASAAIDAAALAMCTADYVPGFLYTVAKYDPF
jgi:RHS repeat-associated protein